MSTRGLSGPALLVALPLLFARCACEDETVGSAHSLLQVSSQTLDLGEVYVGAEGRGDLTLSAVGELPVRYTAHFEAEAGGWLFGPAVANIGANRSIPASAFFTPPSPGRFSARVILDHNATDNSSIAIDLFATGLEVPDCEDGNGCTSDHFDPNAAHCVHEAALVACDDFNACTTADACVEGQCLGASKSCDDGNLCTDDLCDSHQGCLNVLTVTCDDMNPCTADICDPNGGCGHINLEDGTPCDDFQQCTMADICLLGECRGVPLPDGAMCDDGDPCSKHDECSAGECLDPGYVPPGFGDLKFVRVLGPLGEGAVENPLVDRNSTTYVGRALGVAAIDLCGELLWTSTVGATRFSGAVSLPGILSVPVGHELVDIDTSDGSVLRRVDLARLFFTNGSTTASAAVQLIDLAVRPSGSLVASLYFDDPDGAGRGLIAEIDRSHTLASVFQPLGPRHAIRLAIDADEAILALVRDGRPDGEVGEERLFRLGLSNLPRTSWSTSPLYSVRTDLALGADSQVYWSAGLFELSREGALRPLLPAPLDPSLITFGSPVIQEGRVYMVYRQDLPPLGLGLGPEVSDHLLAVVAASGEIVADIRLEPSAPRMSPVLDRQGNVFVLTTTGQIRGYDPDGAFLFATQVPALRGRIASGTALTLTPDGVIIGVSGDLVFGVQSIAPLGLSSWPRHRRDNFATSHR